MLYHEENGFLDAVVRGYRSAMISSSQYLNLSQCESLDDVKIQLSATEYSNFISNDAPVTVSYFLNVLNQSLITEFNYLRNNATGNLSLFLDYICYAYMIDNVILLITGALHAREPEDLVSKCHPLGYFEAMPALCVAETVQDLYNIVLVDTPLAPYFRGCLSSGDLDEMNIEIIRSTLQKAYLEDFYHFCNNLGGQTAEIMGEILMFEADRRTISITVNSLGTDLKKENKAKLMPELGLLYPFNTEKLVKAEDVETVKSILDGFVEYRGFLDGSKSLDDNFFEFEVKLNRLSFYTQGNMSVFYSYLKLKEQEIRNIIWICECIAQRQRDKINKYVEVF